MPNIVTFGTTDRSAFDIQTRLKWAQIGRHLLAAAFAALLNCGFVATLLSPTRVDADFPDRMRFGNAYGSDSTTFMTAFFVDSPAKYGASQQHDLFFDESIVPPVPQPPAHLSFEVDENQSRPQPAGGQPMFGDPSENQEFVRLRGLYMGQVMARVHRAWERPMTLPDGFDGSTCAALVAQDESGAVLEVELQDCPADLAWQDSIVAAIQRSSPLPAPPAPGVFSARLMLHFDITAFQK